MIPEMNDVMHQTLSFEKFLIEEFDSKFEE